MRMANTRESISLFSLGLRRAGLLPLTNTILEQLTVIAKLQSPSLKYHNRIFVLEYVLGELGPKTQWLFPSGLDFVTNVDFQRKKSYVSTPYIINDVGC